ncbi:hypothetical protein ACQ4PT_051365 [Festuca glaucescens]
MRNFWRIRGHLDMNQLPDRRFVLEFSEEGDYLHVTKGGPWKFKNDVVRVDELKEGVDPESVLFTTVPIWIQFQNIPFYLLSKQLARNLGKIIGELISIDNDARGDICAKILRARVLVPIDQALQGWITLQDEIGEEEVIVSVAYERLPNFCHFCGFIGHQDKDCRLPAIGRKKRYSDDLGVAPTHPEDLRRWSLPDITGQDLHQQPLLWHSRQDSIMCLPEHSLHRQTAVIAHVAQNVGKLSLQDKTIIDNKPRESATSTSTPQPTSSRPKTLTLEDSDKGDKRAPTTTTPHAWATLVSKQQLQHALNLATAAAGVKAAATPPDVNAITATGVGCTVVAPTPTEDMPLKKGPIHWKRVQRVAERDNPNQTKELTTQGGALGAPRNRPGLEDDDSHMQPSLKKKIIFPVPPLEECLGAENLRKLIEEENTPQP